MKLTRNASAWAARLGMAVLALATPLGAQNLVSNPGFEVGFLGWGSATGLSFVSTGPCNTGTPSSVHGGLFGTCLATGHLEWDAGELVQSLGTIQGHTYAVSFWLQHAYDETRANQNAFFTASWGFTGIPFYTNVLERPFNYRQENFLLVASEPFRTQLSFRFSEGFFNSAWWSLDDVSVLDLGVIPEVVIPEPTSVVLLGTGLVGLAALVRRRRRTL